MTGRTRILVTIVAACALVALALLVVARGAIEREVFVRQATRALGTTVTASSADYEGGVWRVSDLAIAPGGTSTLAASRATIEMASPLRVTLDDARASLADVPAFAGASGAFARTYPRAVIGVRAARLAIGDVAAIIAGTVRAGSGVAAPSFDGTVTFADGGATYAVAARATTRLGTPVEHLDAAALPATLLAALGGYDDDAAMKPTGGTLRDVVLDVSPRDLEGSARLDDVSFGLVTHRLHGLHGELVFGDGGVGSQKIEGALDAVPFDAAGEVHDLPEPAAWIAHGSRDLQAYAKLLREIGDEPGLTSVHLDTTAPGVGYALYAMRSERGPLAINVLTIDPSEPTLRFDTAIAEDHVISNGERTSAMGVRTGAVAGVNGDYFDIGRTYQPQGMLERAGEIVRGPVERAALVIDRDKHVRFDLFRVVGSVRVGGTTYPVTQINDWPAGAATVITPAFGATLPPAPGVTFAALVPAGRANRYRVASVSEATSRLPVSFGVAFGATTHARPTVGATVDMTYRVEPNVTGAVAAIGGGPILVRDGAWFEDPHAPAPDERDYRWPVVALARQADDRLLLVAVDGRHPERSIGMTRPEFADLLIRFGVTDAMALDSGGSVTMVSRPPGARSVTVRNVPSDNSAERWVSDALFVYSSAPPPTLVPADALATPVPEARPTP